LPSLTGKDSPLVFVLRRCPLTNGQPLTVTGKAWQRDCDRRHQCNRRLLGSHAGASRRDLMDGGLSPADRYCAAECSGTMPREVTSVPVDYFKP